MRRVYYFRVMKNKPLSITGKLFPSQVLRVLGLALGIIFFAMASTASAHKEVLRVAVEDLYPPFSQLDEEGRPYGFNVDIANALARALNMRCEIHVFNWDELIPALLDNRVDAIIANMAKTPDRSKLVAFTKAYQRSKTGFVGRTGAFTAPPTLRTAKGKRFCTQFGTIQYKYLKQKYGSVAQVIGLPTMEEALRAVVREKCDLALLPLLTAFEFLKSEQGRQCELVGEALNEQEYPYLSSHIAVRKSDTRLCERLNRAIDQIRASGEHYSLSRKYFPFSAL